MFHWIGWWQEEERWLGYLPNAIIIGLSLIILYKVKQFMI